MQKNIYFNNQLKIVSKKNFYPRINVCQKRDILEGKGKKTPNQTLMRNFSISKFKNNTLSHCLNCFHLRTKENKYFSF